MRVEIQIGGFGGQGVGLMGLILGKAFSLFAGYEAVLTQSYGPEARGGASTSNLVISKEPIDYPFVHQPDYLVALSQEAYTKLRPDAKNGAVVLIDEDLVIPEASDGLLAIPATRIAEEMGKRIVANMVMIGFFTSVADFLSRDAVQEAIQATLKPKTIEINLNALDRGYQYGRQGMFKSSELGAHSHE